MTSFYLGVFNEVELYAIMHHKILHTINHLQSNSVQMEYDSKRPKL